MSVKAIFATEVVRRSNGEAIAERPHPAFPRMRARVGALSCLRARLFNVITRTLCMVFVATLAACTGSLLESKVAEPQVYMLQPAAAAAASVAYDMQLAVSLPTATPGLDTPRIAVLRGRNQLDYFYGARWGGTAPQVVQAFLIALLQSQQGYKSTVAESSRMDADYLLDVELRDFQAEYSSDTAAPVARVTLVGTLINIRTRASFGQLRASANVTAADNRLSAVVTAFQGALQQASTQLSTELSASLAKNTQS